MRVGTADERTAVERTADERTGEADRRRHEPRSSTRRVAAAAFMMGQGSGQEMDCDRRGGKRSGLGECVSCVLVLSNIVWIRMGIESFD